MELKENQRLHLAKDKIATLEGEALEIPTDLELLEILLEAEEVLEIPIRSHKEAVMKNLIPHKTLGLIFPILLLFFNLKNKIREIQWNCREELVSLSLKTKS